MKLSAEVTLASRPRYPASASAVIISDGFTPGFAGMTLPSGHYLQHPPQYFAPSPPYPLPRELAAQERVAAEAALAAGGTGAAPVPPPAPVPPVPPGPPAPGGDVAPLPPP